MCGHTCTQRGDHIERNTTEQLDCSTRQSETNQTSESTINKTAATSDEVKITEALEREGSASQNLTKRSTRYNLKHTKLSATYSWTLLFRLAPHYCHYTLYYTCVCVCVHTKMAFKLIQISLNETNALLGGWRRLIPVGLGM